jgi:diadenosine tetraphosphatase ApaH/serine/threonine PP2A family protein phosphatase
MQAVNSTRSSVAATWSATIRANCPIVIRGNHDKAVAGSEDLEWFNEVAQAAARWTMTALNADELQYLRDLPKGPVEVEDFAICHGSLQDEDEYVTSPNEALASFAQARLPLTFFGHTHLQGGFFSKYGRMGSIGQVQARHRDAVLQLEENVLYLINPGAVGQPRDGDPRAAYAILDLDRRLVTLRRVAYPIQKTADDIRDAGLPEMLAARLFQGF